MSVMPFTCFFGLCKLRCSNIHRSCDRSLNRSCLHRQRRDSRQVTQVEASYFVYMRIYTPIMFSYVAIYLCIFVSEIKKINVNEV